MSETRIVGSLVSKNGVTLFLGDGTSEVLTKDTWKTQEILMAIMFPIASQGFADIDLEIFRLEKVLEAVAEDGITIEKTALGTVQIVIDDQRIENAEILKTQIEAVAYDPAAAVGMRIFLKEFAKIAKTRKHSADDLLAFMKSADLQIADDGSIIGYKVLRRKEDGFVDVHSGRVTQRVGSVVQMPPEMVDDNRRNDCSHGLHICSRSYLGSFSGDVICLVKIAVGDVIAVPQYNTNKMRVARYQIVAQLPDDARPLLRGNQPLPIDSEAGQILRNVIAGEYAAATETVTDDRKSVVVEALVGAPAKPKPKRKGKDVKIKPEQIKGEEPVVKTDAKALQKAFDQAVATSSKMTNEAAITKAAAKKAPKKSAAKKSKAEPKKTAPAVEVVSVSADKVNSSHIGRGDPAEVKLAEAQRLKDGGWSLREIEKHLGMCRKSLAKKLN